MFFIHCLALEAPSDQDRSGDIARELHYIILFLCS